jgi:hypothetical protein
VTGLRWQEVFTGADPILVADEEANWVELPDMKTRFWDEDVQKRRAKLMPFVWGTMAKEGQLFGNRTKGSLATVTNDQWFSYPGYNEMSSGLADPKIRSEPLWLEPERDRLRMAQHVAGTEGQGRRSSGTWDTFHEGL